MVTSSSQVDQAARSAVALVSDAVAFVDRSGRVVYANPACETLFGVSDGRLEGSHWVEDLSLPVDRAQWRAALAALIEGGSGSVVARPAAARPSRVLVQWRGAPVGSAGTVGGIVTLVGSALGQPPDCERRDCSLMQSLLGNARPVADAELLAASEAMLRESQRLAKLGSWELNLVTGALHWSDEIFRIFEVDRVTFPASYEAFLSMVHPDDREALDVEYRRALAAGSDYDFVHRIVVGGGRLKWVHERGRNSYDASGRAVRTIGTVQDITDRQRLEDRLQHAQRLAQIGGWEIGTAGTSTWWSDEAFRILGLESNVQNRSFDAYLSRVHPADRDGVVETARVSRQTSAPFAIPHRLLLPDGSVKHVLVQGHPASTANVDGHVWEGTIQDVSAQVQAERRLRSILDGIVAFVGLFTTEGIVVDVNRMPLDASGISRADVVGKRFCDAWWWSYDAAVAADVRTAVLQAAAGETVRRDFRARLSEDRFVILDAVLAPLRGEHGEVEGVIASGVDVTERVAAEAAWRESEEQLRLVLEASGQGVWTVDVDPLVARFSKEHAIMLGFRPIELVTQDKAELIESIHPEDRERVVAAFDAHLQGHAPRYRAEFRKRMRDGSWKWLLGVGRVVEWTDEGRPARLLGTHTDISERIEIETQINRSLHEKEMLLREIHHRVKNNLQVIASLMHFQSKRIPGPAAAATFVELRQRIYAMTLVHERLYQSSDVARVDLGEYIQSLVSELARSFDPRPGVTIEVHSEEVFLPIEIALPCGMLLCELVTNVLKYAFPDRTAGVARVDVRRHGATIELEVSDDGVGLPDELGPQAGGGFGWELIRMLALQLSGEIDVGSGLGGGACIRVVFPANEPTTGISR